jgi:predicted alpha/beta hydrolase family esterase
MSEEKTFLILHGWGGNKPAHWQEYLAMDLADAGAKVHYPKMPTPMAPNLAAWLTRLHDELKEIPEGTPLTVLCHSLGGINWMHYVTASTRMIADRVLLVAPPYVVPGVPPTDAPPGVEGFFPPPLDAEAIARASKETHIIASNDDDYATFEQSKAYAERLNVPIHLLEGAGHVSPYWGYGEWPWMLDWCLGKAEMPPQPRPST